MCKLYHYCTSRNILLSLLIIQKGALVKQHCWCWSTLASETKSMRIQGNAEDMNKGVGGSSHLRSKAVQAEYFSLSLINQATHGVMFILCLRKRKYSESIISWEYYLCYWKKLRIFLQGLCFSHRDNVYIQGHSFNVLAFKCIYLL